MEIRRVSTKAGGLAPRAISVLSANFPSPLFNLNYQLRHPLGIYNISVRHILTSFNQVLTLLEEIIEQMNKTKYYNADKFSDLAMQQRFLLYFLMEHLDDCENIIRCFFETSKDFEKSKVWKVYQKQIKKYRVHIGTSTGHLKHKRGEITPLFAVDEKNLILGYFVEGVGEKGEIKPYQNLHESIGFAISFARDLRFHFVWLYLLSEYLSDAIIELTAIDPTEIDTEVDDQSFNFYRIAERITQIPPVFFRPEIKLANPQLELRSFDKNIELFISYPGELITSSQRSGKTLLHVIYTGDGISDSFGTA